MQDFPVQFTEVHWDQRKTETGKVEKYVVELEEAARAGRPVILVIYARTEGVDMPPEEWNLIARFFEARTELTELAGDFLTYGMNRGCACWASAPMRVDRPMILLFDHRGKVVRRIDDERFPFERLYADMKTVDEKADREAARRGSAAGVQETDR